MPILTRLTDIYDFMIFEKLWQIHFWELQNCNFEILSFSCFVFKNHYFPETQICAMGSWVKNLKTFHLYSSFLI